jgi:hypothetical protein
LGRRYRGHGGGQVSRAHHAYQMGALAFECDLLTTSNPFEEGTEEADQWDAGHAKAATQWRAAKRAELADRYGDEAADEL